MSREMPSEDNSILEGQPETQAQEESALKSPAESLEREPLNAEQLLEDEKTRLKAFKRKATKMVAAFMLASSITFGVGCNRDTNLLKGQGVQAGETLQKSEKSEEEQEFIKKLEAIPSTFETWRVVAKDWDYMYQHINLRVLKNNLEALQENVPAEQRISEARIDELVRGLDSDASSGKIDFKQSVEEELKRIDSIIDGKPELLLNETQNLGREIYQYADSTLGNNDGKLDAKEEEKANQIRYMSSSFVVRDMELEAQDRIKELNKLAAEKLTEGTIIEKSHEPKKVRGRLVFVPGGNRVVKGIPGLAVGFGLKAIPGLRVESEQFVVTIKGTVDGREVTKEVGVDKETYDRLSSGDTYRVEV